MTKLLSSVVVSILVAAPAFASERDDANSAAKAAVAAQAADGATTPTAPTLPTQASAKAQNALATIAFGQKGATERAAHAQAQQDAASETDNAKAAAAHRAAGQAIANAVRSAIADTHSAAGQTRAAAGGANGQRPSSIPTPTSHPGGR